MSGKIFLKAGESFAGSANERYPHGKILNVKGFYDQNSHEMPENLIEVKKELIEGITSSWVEYVPASYDGSKPAPLIISRHGGGQSGWGQCYATSWCYVADREGFIVVYPDMMQIPRDNNAPPSAGGRPSFSFGDLIRPGKDSPMLKEMLLLIDEMKSKYNIDSRRIFMQGMSMGDLMTTQFALNYGELLAGIGEAAGPSNPGDYFNEDGSLKPYSSFVPTFVSFVSNNNAMTPPEQRPVSQLDWKEMKDLLYWRTLAGCTGLPKFRIFGIENYAFYEGEKAPVYYRDVLGRGHGQTFDDADMLWRTMFSGLYREADGSVTFKEPDEVIYDKNAVAIADGRANAYLDNKKVSLDDCGTAAYYFDYKSEMDEKMYELTRGMDGYDPILYVPVTFLSALGFEVTVSECKKYAKLIAPAGEEMHVSLGNVGVVINNRIFSLPRQVESHDGVLCVPIKWFAATFLSKHVTERDGVMYISDTYGEMTPNIAAIISDILK